VTVFLSVVLAFSVLMNVVLLAVAARHQDEVRRLRAKLEDGEVAIHHEKVDPPVMLQRLRQDR
jgi:hypothetical protein